MNHYVYRITCNHPDSTMKYYYGSRTSKNLPENDNYWSSSTYVHEAIQEYGLSFFTKKVVRVCDNRDEAFALEIALHERFAVDRHPRFFNKSKQTKFGFNCTGLTVKGKTYEEIVGEERGSELREMRRVKAKGKNNKGEHNPMFGKNHTDETRAALSDAKQGDKHPFWGMMWITDGKESLRVPKDSELPPGWHIGRTAGWNKGKEMKKTHCPHCGKLVSKGNMKRWHGDKCKQKPIE